VRAVMSCAELFMPVRILVSFQCSEAVSFSVGRNKPGVAFGHNQSGEPGGVSPRTLPDRNFVRPGGLRPPARQELVQETSFDSVSMQRSSGRRHVKDRSNCRNCAALVPAYGLLFEKLTASLHWNTNEDALRPEAFDSLRTQNALRRVPMWSVGTSRDLPKTIDPRGVDL
jgi:hypothetical protein